MATTMKRGTAVGPAVSARKSMGRRGSAATAVGPSLSKRTRPGGRPRSGGFGIPQFDGGKRRATR